jgi:hypothetical protein
MTLDTIYINEAKRIRKIYLTNLTNIVEKEDDIQTFLKMINDIKSDIEDNEENENIFQEKLLNINKNISKIKDHIMPYYDEIKKLDESQRILYNNIKDKYPNITDDEIQEQIVPYIKTIDLEFINKNKEIYQKIVDKKK